MLYSRLATLVTIDQRINNFINQKKKYYQFIVSRIVKILELIKMT